MKLWFRGILRGLVCNQRMAKKVKLSHSTPWKHTGAAAVWLSSFLNPALDGGDWSNTSPGRFISPGKDPGTHWIVDVLEKTKILLPCRDLKPGTPIYGLVTDGAIPALSLSRLSVEIAAGKGKRRSFVLKFRRLFKLVRLHFCYSSALWAVCNKLQVSSQSS